MAQKKTTSINPFLIGFLSALMTMFGGVLTNQFTPSKEFPQKNEYIVVIVVSIAFALSGLSSIEAARQEENSSRRKFLISSFFAVTGIGGTLNYGWKFIKEGWLSNDEKVVASSTPSPTPTKISNEVTPPRKTTPQSEPSPANNKQVVNLVKGSFSFKTVEVDEKGRIIKEEAKTTSVWSEILEGGVPLEMIYIPAGNFTMGSPIYEKGHNEKKQIPEEQRRNVGVQPLLMGRYSVTQSQWKSVSKLARIKIDLAADPSHFKGDLRPVERITWDEAEEFCARLSSATGREYRLPTEAEWEYACRANTTTPFYFGNTITTDLANYDGNSETYNQEPTGRYRKETTEVGIFPANAYGLFDMHGNVWEWCLDNWGMNGKSFNIIRGGSWYTSSKRCRSANRTPLSPDNRGDSNPRDSVGFRVVCVPKMDIFR